jgi:hypothetical protein
MRLEMIGASPLVKYLLMIWGVAALPVHILFGVIAVIHSVVLRFAKTVAVNVNVRAIVISSIIRGSEDL